MRSRNVAERGKLTCSRTADIDLLRLKGAEIFVVATLLLPLRATLERTLEAKAASELEKDIPRA